MGMVGEDMEKGLTRDWGEFVGQTNGYAISEGTESDVMLSLAQYTPYCNFKVHPVATEGQVVEMMESLYGSSDYDRKGGQDHYDSALLQDLNLWVCNQF